jgi:hypothetical protein
MGLRHDRKYDIWLIDSITALLYKVETGIEEEDAIEWLKEWNRNHRDCICIMALQEIAIPTTIQLAGNI